MGLGATEILLILLILVLIFGARRLPEIGKGLGEGLNNFKSALSGGSKKDTKEIKDKSDSNNNQNSVN